MIDTGGLAGLSTEPSSRPFVGIVTGLIAEARIAERLGRVEAGGGTPEGAGAAARRLVDQGARALVSFGLAGGLDPALRAGALVVPLAVLDGGGSWRTDPVLSDQLGGWFGGFLLGEQRIVARRSEKAVLFARTRACAVDLESGAVARVAAAYGLPFAVLRAVCDGASRSLPPAALTALDPAGRVRLGRLAASLAANPFQLAGLVALGREAASARSALVRRVDEIVGRGGLLVT